MVHWCGVCGLYHISKLMFPWSVDFGLIVDIGHSRLSIGSFSLRTMNTPEEFFYFLFPLVLFPLLRKSEFHEYFVILMQKLEAGVSCCS